MTREEIIDKIRKISGRTEEEIYEYCERVGISLEQYNVNIDKAIAARKQKMPPDYPKAIITIPQK